MGCCNYITRFISVFAGIFSLIQSVIWIALAFIGLSLYNCDMRVHYKENPAGYLIFLIYFYTGCALSPNVELEFDNSVINGTISWPNRLESVYTAHQLNLAYVVLSCLWAVTSLLLIGASICKTRILFAYLPWILTTVANLVLDVVATITFAQHISKTQGLKNFLNFLGAQYSSEMLPEVPDELTTIPSIIMTLLSARFFVLWLLNLLILICGIVAAWNLSNNTSKQKNQPYRQPIDEQSSDNSNLNAAPVRPFSYIPGTDVAKQFTREQADYNQRRTDMEIREKAALSKQLAPQLQRLQDRLSSPYSPGIMPSEDEAGRRRLSYNTRPPEELRGQLPWSYFNARDELGPASNQPRPWDRPPVPVPDYTLHFGKKARYNRPDDASSTSSLSNPKRLP